MRSIELGSESLQQFKAAEPLILTSESDVRINNVLGINKHGSLPARFLSGLVPTFNLARSIQEKSDGLIIPEVRIFRPVHIFQHTNGLSETEVTTQLEDGNKSLRTFQQKYFPETTLFIEDDNPINGSSLEVLDAVKIVVEEQCEPETINALRSSGNRHGGKKGEGNAMIYAAHHPFGWNDAFHPAIFPSRPPVEVINTLPPSEKKFNQIRERIVPFISTIPEVIVFDRYKHELNISMSGTPHYQILEDEFGNPQEPTLAETNSTPVFAILDDMQKRFASEKDMFLKEKLRGIRRDFQNLLDFLTNGRREERKNESLLDLMGNDWSKP